MIVRVFGWKTRDPETIIKTEHFNGFLMVYDYVKGADIVSHFVTVDHGGRFAACVMFNKIFCFLHGTNQLEIVFFEQEKFDRCIKTNFSYNFRPNVGASNIQTVLLTLVTTINNRKMLMAFAPEKKKHVLHGIPIFKMWSKVIFRIFTATQ